MPELMSSNVPRIDLPDGNSVPVLHPSLVEYFHSYPPAFQRKTIRILEQLLSDVRTNASMEYMFELGLATDEDVRVGNGSQETKKTYVHNLIDTCCWQLSRLLKYSVPSRIGEAVPHLTYIVESHRRMYPHFKDPIPLIYLGMALTHAGDDTRAIETLTEGLTALHSATHVIDPRNMLRAHSHLVWLLRKAGKTHEAKYHEMLICDWILAHPYAAQPKHVIDAITDDDIPEIGEYVLRSPTLASYFEMARKSVATVGVQGDQVVIRWNRPEEKC